MGEGRLVTNEELEQLIAQRLKQREEIISQAVEALKPALEGVRKEIRDANHIKRTLGRQLATLARLQKETNAKLDSHTHPLADAAVRRLNDAVEVVGELGVDTLSVEQRRALPEVLEEHIRAREETKQQGRADRNRQAWLQAIGAAAGSIAGALTAGGVILGYLWNNPIGVHH